MSAKPQQYLLTWSNAGIECEKTVDEKYLNATLDMLLQNLSLVVVEMIKVQP